MQSLILLIDQYEVDMVLMGHDHDYEVTAPMKGAFKVQRVRAQLRLCALPTQAPSAASADWNGASALAVMPLLHLPCVRVRIFAG